MKKDRTTIPSSKLVEEHNALLAQVDKDAKPLGAWKGKKSVLIDRIEELEKRLAPKKKGTDKTIREVALNLLCAVDYHEDKSQKSGPTNRVEETHPKARSVGVPYLEIIRRIKDQFPEAETSVACLRWYAVKVRAQEFGYEGYRLAQRRPRAKPEQS